MAAIFLVVFVLVTIPIQRIFGLDCSVGFAEIQNCDQCIKCGGSWCINPKDNEHHCGVLNRADTGCSSEYNEIYGLLPGPDPRKSQKNPPYYEDSINIGETETIEVIAPPKDKVDFSVTGNSSPQVNRRPSDTCHGDKCLHVFKVDVDEEFCSDTGGPVQNFNVTFKSRNVEIKQVKYNVACECACSKNVSHYDKYCSGRGNLTCGACACDDRWKGKHCEREKPYDEREYKEPPITGDCPGGRRGDTYCEHELRPHVECSGNGYCYDCCICNKTKAGWQYFIPEKYCEDLCMTTAELLRADVNSPEIRFIQYNETETMREDSQLRKVWVKCNETIEEFMWEFYARKNVKGEIGVMIVKKSSPEAAAIESGGVNVTALVVPLVVAAALAAAAVAYYVFKGQGAAPQPSRANYQGLDGPKTRVETNPVYIEPIKSYKNPTYVQNK